MRLGMKKTSYAVVLAALALGASLTACTKESTTPGDTPVPTASSSAGMQASSSAESVAPSESDSAEPSPSDSAKPWPSANTRASSDVECDPAEDSHDPDCRPVH